MSKNAIVTIASRLNTLRRCALQLDTVMEHEGYCDPGALDIVSHTQTVIDGAIEEAIVALETRFERDYDVLDDDPAQTPQNVKRARAEMRASITRAKKEG